MYSAERRRSKCGETFDVERIHRQMIVVCRIAGRRARAAVSGEPKVSKAVSCSYASVSRQRQPGFQHRI
jgi:hypothetical protein